MSEFNTIRVIDLETTGFPNEDGRICEVGWTNIIQKDGTLSIGDTSSIICNPGVPMPPQASAVHHLLDQDVSGGIEPIEALKQCLTGCDLIVAHQADFEKAFIEVDRPWICTYKVARRLWPDCPSFTNQYFRYFLNLKVDPEAAMPPHRAGPDSHITAYIFTECAKKLSLQEMVDISLVTALQYRCHFGNKHRGKTWEEIAYIDREYLQWIVDKVEDNEEVRYAANYWLRRGR